ncbi:hypothetical protein [Planococcus salinus]|uniref:Uncharacterized protein n=1 Tax=Planococcus salinus TaxID=1848460 RepID=A0A3M8P797_9BACL|nr:hypothetical protein [Planococcus salinus]RNF39545.1 hypothetical protein EEX84_08705 [Planococcus salinus]
MSNKRLIHTYIQPKTKSLWCIFCLAALVAGCALVIAPAFLYIRYRSAWLLLLLVFIPLGFWINRHIIRMIRKLFWQNRHLSTYHLFAHMIETTEWTTAHSTEPVKRKIPLTSVITVVAAPYFIRQVFTSHKVSRALTGTAPVLFILYTEKGKTRLLDIPFSHHDDSALNVWLNHFQKQLVPIDFTACLLYRKDGKLLNEEQRIAFIESTDELMPLSFSGDWQTDFPFAWEAWNDRALKRRRVEEKSMLMEK